MSPPEPEAPFELVATVVRALVLYALAESQNGSAGTIRVSARGAEFSVGDDGRGHPPDKMLEGTSYLRFVYTHFEYPFETGRAAPVQLQGIGMSLVNALCSELTLVLRKPEATLHLVFREGRLHQHRHTEETNPATGVTLSGRLRPALCTQAGDGAALQAGLQAIALAHPGLALFYNGRPLRALPPAAE